MVVTAVLPLSTGWGFSHQAATELSPLFDFDKDSQPEPQHHRAKRRISDVSDGLDAEPMPHKEEPAGLHKMNSMSLGTPHVARTSPRRIARVHKKSRTQHGLSHGRALPVARQLESLDRETLIQLIQGLCEASPEIDQAVASAAPRITTNTAMEALHAHLRNVHSNLPYKGDPAGDYAYLRVRPYVEEFLAALEDYVSHFMQMVETHTPTTIAFLDSATELLHKLPEWSNPLNNHPRNATYDEMNQAWILVLRHTAQKSPIALAHGGWQERLHTHNRVCGGRLDGAVEVLNSLV